jgi:hypothetical protein
LERRTETVINRSRKKGNAVVTLAITAAIIILALFVISLLVVVR